jgi:GT2 family glycosyltransferase
MYESLIETLSADLDVEIVFIDDASTDETPYWLNTLPLNNSSSLNKIKVKQIRNSHNLGYAKSNNLAAEVASGEVLVLLNNDLILKKGWLEPMLTLLCHNKSVPSIVGNLQYRIDSGELDHAGVIVNLDSKTDRVFIDHCKEKVEDYYRSIFAVTGACCLIARETFDSVEGFDEVYVNGGEDIDLCLKIKNNGGICCIANSSAVMHHVSLTRGRSNARDELNSWTLFKRWKDPIIRELEFICASRLIDTLPNNEFTIKSMIYDFILGNRKVAPLLVKVTASKFFQNEITRFEQILFK